MDAKTSFTPAPATSGASEETPVAGGWAQRARRTLAERHVRLGPDREIRIILAQARCFPRARLSCRHRLYGPGQLGDVARRWLASLATRCSTVALMSNIMAIILQALCARLGVGAGRDLAQACRDAFPRRWRGRSGCSRRLRLPQPTSRKLLAPPSASICCSAFRLRSGS